MIDLGDLKPDWTSDDGNVVLFNADCLDILPQIPAGCVDAVVTDPPYGIGVNHNMGRRKGDAASDYLPAHWDSKPPSQECFDLMFSCSEHQIIWGANHFADRIGRPSPCWLVWDKLFSPDVSFASCELAWTSLPRVVRKFQKSSQRRNGVHPTQKPVSLMTWCLDFLPDAQIILDPFLGSGTTAVACVKTGRKCIGIEKEPKYFDIAVDRVQRAYADAGLFTGAIA